MATKLKKSRPFLIWLCFFVGVNLLLLFAIGGIASLQNIFENFNDITAILRSDLKETKRFKQDVANRFDTLARSVTDRNESRTPAADLDALWRHEGENFLYRAEDANTGRVLANYDSALAVSEKGFLKLPEGYDFYLFYENGRFKGVKNGVPLDIYRLDSGYWNSSLWMYMGNRAPRSIPDMKGVRILVAVKKDIVMNPYAFSEFYDMKQWTVTVRWILWGIMAAFILTLALLGLALVRRREKGEFDRKLAGISGRVLLEIKAGVSLLLFVFLLFQMRVWYPSIRITRGIGILFAVFVCIWWFYLMITDLRINRRQFFTNNLIHTAIYLYHSFERKKPFQQAMLLRVYMLMAAEGVLGLVAIFLCGSAVARREGGLLIAAVLPVAAGGYLLYRYLRRYTNTVNDIGCVIDRIEAIKNGDMTNRHDLKPDADLYPVEESLNQIQDGVSRAAEEKIKSERTKIELITNVSHDLKTPLTSIISYVDLLGKEEGLPEHVNDYVRILSQKSDRLKTLIQDIFDLSRAAGGDMAIEQERLDLGKLIRQTLADLNEQLLQSGLIFKVTIPEEPVYIVSDGNKLYRVFLNLFSNALKYSLPGTRVYIELGVSGTDAAVVIKNTANYEMNFSEGEILERFARGDKARSTEGSGLGLAIAQSFIQACGGSFGLKVDGDLFKVRVGFKLDVPQISDTDYDDRQVS